MPDAFAWLSDARALLQERDNGLLAAGPQAGCRGFVGGAGWMRQAMSTVRGRQPGVGIGDASTNISCVSFRALGARKYAYASLVAVLVAVILWWLQPWLLPLAVVAFYLVEVRMVFAFPAAIDGSASPLRDSHALLRATMNWANATQNVMILAGEMLFGGLLGRGFVRSWCVGCLAVVLWYEEARASARVAT